MKPASNNVRHDHSPYRSYGRCTWTLHVLIKENATTTNNHIINTHFPAFLLAAAITNKAENKDDGTGLCSMDG